MLLFDKIRTEIVNSLHRKYGRTVDPDLITVTPTRREFEGDMTVVIFPVVKELRKSPAELGTFLGEGLVARMPEIESFNQIQGFLNFTLTASFWEDFLKKMVNNPSYGIWLRNGEKVMIEFSSPNTNKPLHLGHIRNILLGWSCSRILVSAGFDVVKVQVINDRGIAICKSMLAWTDHGNGATPQSESMKGDHFVGKYYVLFEQLFISEYKEWQKSEIAKKLYESRNEVSLDEYSDLGARSKEMLRKWEVEDPEVIELWKLMNGWVYVGFEKTYERLGVSFDKLYYESETWKLGKKEILEGLDKKKFYQKEDGSIWVDLSHEGMDEKILLRSDGTSVYITQDIGTAMRRYQDFGIDHMVYVVADEQNHHFRVLFEILNLLDEPYVDGLHHLAYGMVDLPSGKMKSREGTVVDADDLLDEVISEAKQLAQEKGDISDLAEEEQEEVFRKVGIAALKFFILKVNPSKRMTFDPSASVDMHGQTGPYIQNAFVRIKSIGRKAGAAPVGDFGEYLEKEETEKVLLNHLFVYPEIIKKAAEDYDPSLVAGFCFDLAKSYHRFYHDVPILSADNAAARAFRLTLNEGVSKVLEHGMEMLGIEMPERM
ncbi:UNVERIFIED_CONTAM: hypothetical protein GTU68_064270 [Idotea baltica]|nr:hypothetical protein [Idotea baltica]